MALLTNYREKIVPKLAQEFGLKNPYSVPRVTKVVFNMGIGGILDSREEQERVALDLAKIAGQKPSLRQARKSVASFGIRKGQHVGLSVTIRGRRMYDFLEKLFNIALPRLRDFKGVAKKSLDVSGNYTLGIAEHTVFPEVDLGKVGKVRGFEITIVTNTRNKEHAARLLEELGMPFEREENG